MTAKSPAHAIELLDNAFNKGDLDTILRYYDQEAIVMPEPGIEVRGLAEIRSFYLGSLKTGTTVKQLKTHVLEADGIALFTSRYTITAEGSPPHTFVATTVFRQQPDGGWKALIDNAHGPEVLG